MSNKVELSEIDKYTMTPIDRIQPNSQLVRAVISEIKKSLNSSLNETFHYFKFNSSNILQGRRLVQKISVGTNVAEFRILTDDISRRGRLVRLSQILNSIKSSMFKQDVGIETSWKKQKNKKFQTSAGGSNSYEQLEGVYNSGTEIEIRLLKDVSTTATSTGGKDPRLLIAFEATIKNVIERNKKVDKKVYFHILIDIKPRAEKIEIITPKKLNLTGKWFTIDDYVAACKTGIQSLQSPGKVKEYMNNLLDYFNPKNSKNATIVDATGCYEYLSSESSEIFSPLHFISDVQTSQTRKTLALPEDDIYSDLSKWYILIPSSANEELVDYFVFCGNKPTATKDVDGAIKISVKNVGSSSSGATATVKFPTMFNNTREVNDWYGKLSNTTKKKHQVQKIIAENSVETKSTLYPILALKEIKNINKTVYESFSRNQLRKLSSQEKQYFEKALDIISGKFNSIQKRYDDIDIHITDEKVLNGVKAVIVKVILETSKDYKNYIDSLSNPLQPGVYLNHEQFDNVFSLLNLNDDNKRSLMYPFAINNFSLICERILADSTNRNASFSYKNNFYKMFFDAILCKKMIIYSKSSYINGVFNFTNYGRMNFGASVNYWLGLRSKNYANNLKDSLGIQT
jgi:hypothetical protein